MQRAFMLSVIIVLCGCGRTKPLVAGTEWVWNPQIKTWTNAEIRNRLNETPVVFGGDHKGIDRAFAAKVYRLTGPTGSNALIENDLQTRNNNPWMHFANPWSRSGDHFILESYGNPPGKNWGAYVTRIMTLDRENFTVALNRVIPKTPNGQALVSQNKGLWFSPNEELLLFGTTPSVAQLWAYNADTKPVELGTKTIPANGFLLMADFSEMSDVDLAFGQGFMWQDGKTFSYGIKKGSGEALGVVVYSWTDDPQDGKKTFISVKNYKMYDETWADRKHYVWMAGSNDGVAAHFPNPGERGIVRYDRTGRYADCIRKLGPKSFHASTGKACGYDGWWINRNWWEHNRMFLRRATDIRTFYQVWPPHMTGMPGEQGDPLGIGDGFTCNPSFHLKDWVYLADYSVASKAGADYTKAPTAFTGQDEIVAVDVSTPGKVSRFRRICRLWSDDVDRSYKYQPDCTPSPANDYVLYWSNMAAAGEDYKRTDSFLVRVNK